MKSQVSQLPLFAFFTERQSGGARRSYRFYFWTTAILTLLTIAGFAPSFFLRDQNAAFQGQPLPAWVTVHGALLTAWFLIAVAQAWLIMTRRRKLHRMLGYLGFVCAWAAVPLTFMMVAYLEATGSHVTGGAAPNLILTIIFIGCVSLGVVFRRSPEAHKTLMLFASAFITAPGAERLLLNVSRLFFPNITVDITLPLTLMLLLGFILWFVYTDWRAISRPGHGIVLVFICAFVSALVGHQLPNTEWWHLLVAQMSPQV